MISWESIVTVHGNESAQKYVAIRKAVFKSKLLLLKEE
jgi:hypothetical protein